MRMLQLPPIPLMPPIRRSHRSPRGFVVASLVTAGSLALTATLQAAAASPTSVQPLAGQSGTASAGNVFPEDLVWWWPLNVGSATSLFHCWPNAAKSSTDSVVVWTDKANHVVAFGAAKDAAQLPAYATALGTTGKRDASPFVQIAGKGHVVRVTEKKSALKLNGMQLDCVRTSDD
jgi:hypothetical protein